MNKTLTHSMKSYITIFLVGILVGCICRLTDYCPADTLWSFSSIQTLLGFWIITNTIIVLASTSNICAGISSFLYMFGMTLRVNPKFCVNAKLRCKIEQKCFKAGAAQAAAAFSTKITALRGDVKGGGVSLRSSRLLTFRLQPVSPACGRQRTPLTVRELRSSPAAFRSTSS